CVFETCGNNRQYGQSLLYLVGYRKWPEEVVDAGRQTERSVESAVYERNNAGGRCLGRDGSLRAYQNLIRELAAFHLHQWQINETACEESLIGFEWILR